MINNKLILILFLIFIIFFLIYYLNNYNFYNNILLLKFVDYNNNDKIISKYPINNYPNKYKIKIYNIKENIIQIPSTYIENFSLCYGKKGEDGIEGDPGLPGIESEKGEDGQDGSDGSPAIYKICNECNNGDPGKKGEWGNLVKSVIKDDAHRVNIEADNGDKWTTGILKGDKGEQGIKQLPRPEHTGPVGDTGPLQTSIHGNHKTKYLVYMDIQTINITDRIYKLGKNCVMFAHINNDGSRRPAVLFIVDDICEKLGYPDKNYYNDNHDGGDWTGIVAPLDLDDSVGFKIHHTVNDQVATYVPNIVNSSGGYRGRGYSTGSYVYTPKTMTVVSFWWN